MKLSVALTAATAWLAIAPAGLLLAQNQPAGSPPNSDGSFTYVLKLDEDSLLKLQQGQSLKSVIPPELRGRVTEIRIEFERTAPVNHSGISTGQYYGPELPDAFANRGTGGGAPSLSVPNFPTGPASSSGFATDSNSNFIPPLQQTPDWANRPANNSGTGLAPVNARESGWPDTNTNRQPNNDSRFSTGTGNQSQPSAGTGSWPSSGGAYVPPGGQPSPPPQAPRGSEFDTAGGAARQNRQETALAPLGPQGNSPSDPNSWRPDAASGGSLLSGYPSDWPYERRAESGLPGYHIPETPAQLAALPNTAGKLADPLDSELENAGNGSAASRLPSAEIPDKQDPAFAAHRPGTDPVTSSAASRYTRFLYFWLLCSIGLNIYLGWIARGFYVRYRELADELRDSFATV